MRGSIVPIALAAMLLVAGGALATTPIPPMERSVAVGNMDFSYTREELVDKNQPIGPFCYRQMLCVGPYDPDVDMGFGRTGARFIVNDTNVTAGHDPKRHLEYGPYVVPLLFDDLRVCYHGCTFPNSLYGSARVNATVMVYVNDNVYSYSIGGAQNVSPEQPGIIPRTWGCQYANDGCP